MMTDKTKAIFSKADNVADIVVRKNIDYNDSFTKTCKKYPDAFMIRLTDKFNRLEQTCNNRAEVDETITDTVTDIIGYCLLWLTDKEMSNDTK